MPAYFDESVAETQRNELTLSTKISVMRSSYLTRSVYVVLCLPKRPPPAPPVAPPPLAILHRSAEAHQLSSVARSYELGAKTRSKIDAISIPRQPYTDRRQGEDVMRRCKAEEKLYRGCPNLSVAQLNLAYSASQNGSSYCIMY